MPLRLAVPAKRQSTRSFLIETAVGTLLLLTAVPGLGASTASFAPVWADIIAGLVLGFGLTASCDFLLLEPPQPAAISAVPTASDASANLNRPLAKAEPPRSGARAAAPLVGLDSRWTLAVSGRFLSCR